MQHFRNTLPYQFNPSSRLFPILLYTVHCTVSILSSSIQPLFFPPLSNLCLVLSSPTSVQSSPLQPLFNLLLSPTCVQSSPLQPLFYPYLSSLVSILLYPASFYPTPAILLSSLYFLFSANFVLITLLFADEVIFLLSDPKIDN